MNKDKIILWVPCNLKFTETVENIVEVIRPLFNSSLSTNRVFEIKLVLNEAFVNVVRHSSQNVAELVEIIFEMEPQSLKICLKDKGKGLAILEHFPPYPQKLIGTSQVFLKTMDGEVRALVEDSVTLQLTFNEINIDEFPPEYIFEKTQDRGMGISLMTKLMDEVRFKYMENEGNYLELIKNLAPK
ncbi:MAG: ATP-binding protein [bacterium]